MCGIAGWVDSAAIDSHKDGERRGLLERMCDVIHHRGPDEQGTGLYSIAAIGMRRLSIIDVSGGHQPMHGCDPATNIVFNGEIYNFPELKTNLEARGHRFRTRSDTEAIVHAYEEYGEACVEHLRGMFAFAIWDDKRGRMFIARDRVGKKPLYYSITASGALVFGSEIKSLLQHSEVPREINRNAIDAYLTLGYVPDPMSIFEGIKKLPPGSTLVFENGRVEIKQYWDFEFPLEKDLRSEAEIVEELRGLLDEAVRVRLISDVPLGAFLSGGVDSSAVVAFMARNSTQPVKTFSIGFREDSFDELKYARVAAKHFETDHTEFVVTPDICSLVDKLVRHFDEPFADSSALPTYMVSKLARDKVTVALSGDGGDELFAGYTRYAIDNRRRSFANLPSAFRSGLIRPLSAKLPHGAYGRNYLHNISLDAIARYTDSVSIFTSLARESLYSDSFGTAVSPNGVLDQMYELASCVESDSPLERLMYIDSKSYLAGDILVKVDRMSMAASLETRAPLLDQKLIDFVARIPPGFKMRKGETKYIFKRALDGIVPDEILHRKKQGFGVPIQAWINNELKDRIHDTVLDRKSIERGYFNRDYLEVLFDEHRRGRRDHSHQLWSLFMLELWHRAYVDEAADSGSGCRQQFDGEVFADARPVQHV